MNVASERNVMSIDKGHDKPHSDQSFGITWHNMAESALNDGLMKGTVLFVDM